ncbi:MAG: Lrp/AsnC family transcriptional regulator, partial [Nitrososphaerales archaeon]
MLDDTDEMLLKTLSKHPRISQVELAKKVGLTQPAVSLRLRKLERTRVINDPGVAIDASTLGLKMMRVDLQTRESSKLTEKFSRCPAVVDSYALEGNKGMCMILAGESTPFLNCMVMRHLKKNPDVRSVRSERITTSMRGLKPS